MKHFLKQALAALLALLMILTLVACDTGSISEITGGEGDSNGEGGSNGGGSSNKVTISEQQCFAYNGITVTAKEYVSDSIWGDGIKITVENNSSKTYTVSTEEVIVNNYMVDSLFVCEVAAGKKANDTLYLSSSDLEAAGISNIGQIEIYFYVYDSATYDTVYTASCVTIKTSQYSQMDTTANDAGKVLYNAGGIKIVGKYVDENTFWGSAILLYIENKTNQNITVSCEDMSINGYMVSGLLSSTVYKNKYSIDEISVLETDLSENGITKINEVELKFHIFNSDTYDTIVDTDPITFQVH